MIRSAFALAAILAFATEVLGQARPPVPKGVIEIDGAYRTTSETLTDGASPIINVEAATISTSNKISAGAAFRGGGAIRIWRRLGAGVRVGRFSTSGDGAVSATIPHPFDFARGRQTQGTVGLSRQELSVAAQVWAFIPISRKISASVFGGPAWSSVSQQMVTSIDYSESYPYDSIAFRSAPTTEAKKSRVGPSVGADLSYFFSRQVGLGAGVNYSGGKIALPSMGGGTVNSKIGGLDVGAGLRIRF